MDWIQSSISADRKKSTYTAELICSSIPQAKITAEMLFLGNREPPEIAKGPFPPKCSVGSKLYTALTSVHDLWIVRN